MDWAVIDESFSDPFFEQTVHRAMQHPFNQIFARTTPLGVLDALAAELPPIVPTGFVFHMSRCGSTLIAQMLSRLSSAMVLSEPQPLDGLFRLRRASSLDDDSAARLLRTMLCALSRPCGEKRRLFVKFHAWHVLDLPLIARAFPSTPWIFAFREPRAVLRSQETSPGAEIVPGTLDPRLAGIEPDALASISPDEYCARMLGAFCRVALEHATISTTGARFVDYDTLPHAVHTDVLPLFGVSPAAGETLLMREIATIDAKGEGGAFGPRTTDPGTSAAIESLAAQWLDPLYARLRTSRS